MAVTDGMRVTDVVTSVGMDSLVLVEKNLLAVFFAACVSTNSVEPRDPANYISHGSLL